MSHNALEYFALFKYEVRLTLTFLLGTVAFSLPDLIRYKKILRANCRKLMIIAHPDDEALFFSRILQSDDKDLAVFCLTNGYDPVRRSEFYRAMSHYGVDGHIMKLPDRTVFSFLFCDTVVSWKLRALSRRYGSCETVYTHSPEGEYGHRHHRIIGRNVSRYFESAEIIIPVSPSRMEDAENLLSERQLADKEFVFESLYPTQAGGVKKSLPVWYYHEKLTRLIDGTDLTKG